ncbi:MAG: FKBP-type peptidyl-prolyl cis-trans isomerase [Planctomycetes bacterium]|nr:FKBP-type peptidyl-prolyl cis-trans isomerase [Planctomycetota bacterium]
MRDKVLSLGVLILLLTGSGLYGADSAISVSEAGTGSGTGIFQNAKDQTSYAIGMQIGRSLMSQGVNINVDVLFQAIRDVLEKKEPLLSSADFQKTMATFSQSQRKKQQAAKRSQGLKNRAAAKAFLEANKVKEGVRVTASGLQYQVIKSGSGPKPKKTDRVRVHYHGTLIDGKVFDSSVNRGTPSEFPVNGVIKGWIEALQLMETGAKWKLFIPPELAYGEPGRPSIPPNSALIFEVELLEILPHQ